MPTETVPDSSLALLRDGYEFIRRRARRHESDVFRARLLLKPTICMTGVDAAELFYDEKRFQREGAAPRLLKATLFGRGGVQGLDDQGHRHRKTMFMSLMSPAGIDELTGLVRRHWLEQVEAWSTAAATQDIILFDELERIILAAVCEWTGVPLSADEVEKQTSRISAMIDGSGGVGLRHLEARRGRSQAEAWAESLIEQVRSGSLRPVRATLRTVALHRDADGELLDSRVAAVELLNVIRPTVAVARYITFAAVALHRNTAIADRIRSGDDHIIEPFVQEVRRFYPFFPFAAARVREDFQWRGYDFAAGTRTLLDLYGTNRDGRTWENPDTFRPERFQGREPGAFELIPQGGSDHHTQHRCPGEWITIALMNDAVKILTRAMSCDVPDQDLGIDLSRMPALPASRFILTAVRPQGPR